MNNIYNLKFYVEQLETLQREYDETKNMTVLFKIGQTQARIYDIVKEWGPVGDQDAEIQALKAENEALLAANRDSVLHYDTLYTDYKNLRQTLTDVNHTLRTLRHTPCYQISTLVSNTLLKSSWKIEDVLKK